MSVSAGDSRRGCDCLYGALLSPADGLGPTRRCTVSRPSHLVALGGIGGDAHSVGLTILRHALSTAGYTVLFLGTQTPLEDYFAQAKSADAVLVSSSDGHARYYLKRFPDLMHRYPGLCCRWYLGGDLGAESTESHVQWFHDIGFDRVFAGYVPAESVIASLRSDLSGIPPRALTSAPTEPLQHRRATSPTADCGFVPERFAEERAGVLNQWRTGRAAADIAESAAFLREVPLWSDAHAEAGHMNLTPLAQPRCGVPLPDRQLRLMSGLKEAGAAVLSFQIDSVTRNNGYTDVARILSEIRARHRTTNTDGGLNGYPMVNYGVEPLRRMASVLRIPLQTRHSTRDPRLLAEISFAGGISSFEGGAIGYNIPYYRDYALAESVAAWQYVDRLAGIFWEEHSVRLDREFFGTLTATLIPPSLAIVVNLIEAGLAAEQGVKSFSLGFSEQGNRTQDIATCRTLDRMARRFLANLGYSSVHINTVMHQYMAAFPPNRERAGQLIEASAATAALSGATRVVIKTTAEAFGIPSLADNTDALSRVARGVASADELEIDESLVEQEGRVIEAEADAIIDSVLHAGDGSLATGVPVAFSRGLLDVPFAPSVHAHGHVLAVRDDLGAVRYASTGRLSLPSWVREFNEEKLSARRSGRSTEGDYLLAENDVTRIPRGEFTRWPLDYARWEL